MSGNIVGAPVAQAFTTGTVAKPRVVWWMEWWCENRAASSVSRAVQLLSIIPFVVL